jgi:hypothetical protein
MVELLALLLPDFKAPGSNVGPETGHPGLGFLGFPQFIRQMLESLKLGHDLFFPNPVQFIVFQLTCSTLYNQSC